MTVKNTLKFADERLVPDLIPWHQKQMIKDHTERYRFAQQFVKGQVLDAACGSGYGSILLASKRNITVIGLDISDEAVRYARNKFRSKRVTFLQGNVLCLPFKPKSLDSVVSFETLEHVPHYEKFISEVIRVLKPGGQFIVSTPNILVNGGTANPHHIKELSEREFVEILQKNFTSVKLYGQKGMHKEYLKFVVLITTMLPLGFLRWFVDSLLKMVFRGTVVKPIRDFHMGFVPAFFVAVCKK